MCICEFKRKVFAGDLNLEVTSKDVEFKSVALEVKQLLMYFIWAKGHLKNYCGKIYIT